MRPRGLRLATALGFAVAAQPPIAAARAQPPIAIARGDAALTPPSPAARERANGRRWGRAPAHESALRQIAATVLAQTTTPAAPPTSPLPPTSPALSPRYRALGTLEREAVDEALASRGLKVDPAPEGKVVGAIHVVNHEVFSARDGYFRFANLLHLTTRENILRREVLLAPGAPYDEALVEESVRNLRDADFSSLVAILPVQSGTPGRVDLLVTSRDVWSLRFNTDFDYQRQVLVYLTTSLSENNLFGWRKKASLAFDLFRGSYSLGPSYLDPNVAGTRLQFSASYRVIFDREVGDREGMSVGARLAYPLFSLASRWGASISAGHAEGVARRYVQAGLVPVNLRGTDEVEMLPYIYRVRRQSADASLVRSFGQRVIQRVSGGYTLSVVRPGFHRSFPVEDPVVRQAFAAQVFPPSERLSALYAGYSLFTPRYRVYRDYDTYDLREDALLGPSASASVSHAASWLGSELTYVGLAGSAGWSFDLGDGFQRLSLSWSARLRGGRLIDETRSGGVALASPMWLKAFRLVAEAGATALLRNARPDAYLTLGGENGLRGYDLGEFDGQARWVGHLELRTRPLPVRALRVGAVAFHDIGHAADRWANLRAYHDAGVGLRLLIPQLNFYVLRVDWAVPFLRGRYTRAGLPGRVSAGFRQAF
jgi:hypothetical protein